MGNPSDSNPEEGIGHVDCLSYLAATATSWNSADSWGVVGAVVLARAFTLASDRSRRGRLGALMGSGEVGTTQSTQGSWSAPWPGALSWDWWLASRGGASFWPTRREQGAGGQLVNRLIACVSGALMGALAAGSFWSDRLERVLDA